MTFSQCTSPKTIPIPRFTPVDGSTNFIGRLAREMLRFTEPRMAYYVDQMNAWYSMKTFEEALDMRAFSKLQNAVGTFGLSGLDRFFCFMMVKELQTFTRKVITMCEKDMATKTMLNTVHRALLPLEGVPGNPSKVYTQALQKSGRLWPPILDIVLNVGQRQLLRRQIANELRGSCRFDSKFLATCLQAFNQSLLTDVQVHYADPSMPYPGEDNPLMADLTSYLETAGIHNPLTKIYVTSTRLEAVPLILFLFTLSHLPKLSYLRNTGGFMIKKGADPLDGAALVVGLVTILHQFHAELTEKYFTYAGQYLRAMVDMTASSKDKAADLPQEVINLLVFLEEFVRYGEHSKQMLEAKVPPYILDEFRHNIPRTQ